MTSDELKLKIQALVDNELPESEIAEVMSHVEGSYELRNEYIELLRLRRRLENAAPPEMAPEWYDAVARKAGRRIWRNIGLWAFLGSYVLLLAYAAVTLFVRSGVDSWIKIIVAAGILGFVVLLGVTIGDRIRESRSDRYKEVIR